MNDRQIEQTKDELLYRVDKILESESINNMSFELWEAIDLLREVYETALKRKFGE